MNLAKTDKCDAHYETETMLKTYFHHPNMVPKLSYYLIQHFGISNSSPRYVNTVSTAFTFGAYKYNYVINSFSTFGSGKYGDLQATIAAILFDREARSVVLDYDCTYGSSKEPLLKIIGFMRAMNYQVLEGGYRFSRYFYTLQDMTTKIRQMAFDMKSVYSNNTPLHDTSLISPETWQHITPTIIGFAN